MILNKKQEEAINQALVALEYGISFNLDAKESEDAWEILYQMKKKSDEYKKRNKIKSQFKKSLIKE